MIRVFPPAQLPESTIQLGGSKSISNRHLIISHLLNVHPVLKNLSDSEDTELLQTALLNIKNAVPGTIDVRHAGTDMRFLTALLSITPGEWQLTGSQRMKERPVAELVNALRQLGAEIVYMEKDGYPPLKISGKNLNGGPLKINAGISSQFISALLLIAAKLQNGLILELQGDVVSQPYIELTLNVLNQYGINTKINSRNISVEEIKNVKNPAAITIESDWSSASYWFSVMALGRSGKITLRNLSRKSEQGDSILPEIFSRLGVKCDFTDDGCILSTGQVNLSDFEYDFSNCPDIAPTVAVACFGLGISCRLTGLQTLVIKESNRIAALATELIKAGGKVTTGKTSLFLQARNGQNSVGDLLIDTYNDHRMAMSFAPLAFLFPGIMINDHGVVRKSYPAFWEDLKSLGFSVTSQP